MSKIIIAIERQKFNQLYKFNCIAVSPKNLIHYNYNEIVNLVNSDLNLAVKKIENALPIFQKEEDVILIEIDASKIDFEYSFKFDSVYRIIPLNQLAKELIQVKLNAHFKIENAFTEKLFQEIKKRREIKIRKSASVKLLEILCLPSPSNKFVTAVFESIGKKITGATKHNKTTIDVLINFDTTPSGIPSGNVEGLIKIICTGLFKALGHLDTLRKSPLYNSLFDNYENINKRGIEDAYNQLFNLTDDHRDSIEKLNSVLREENIEGDIFKFCYYFFLIKKSLIKRNGDIEVLLDYLKKEELSKVEFSQAAYLVASMQSFSFLFESLHRLTYAPLFGKVKHQKKQIACDSQIKDENNSKEEHKLSQQKLEVNIKNSIKSEEAKIDENSVSKSDLETKSNNDFKNINEKKQNNKEGVALELNFDIQTQNNIENTDNLEYNSKLNIESNKTQLGNKNKNLSVRNELISNIESKLLLKSSKDKDLWITAKGKIRDLEEVNLGSLGSLFRKEPFITKGKKPKACSTRILDAIKQIYIP